MKKFIKIQVIQQSTFDLLDYEMIVNIDHIITIQEHNEGKAALCLSNRDTSVRTRHTFKGLVDLLSSEIITPYNEPEPLKI